MIINPKESVAIVGESGSGKSTCVSLIMRFYDPDHGQILIDDVDIREFDAQELRRYMGIVMQEPTLFNYTIKENILYGDTQALNSEIMESAEVANAKDFIESSQLSEMVDDTPEALL